MSDRSTSGHAPLAPAPRPEPAPAPPGRTPVPARPVRIEAIFLDVGGVFILPNHHEMVAALAGGGFAIDPDRLDIAHYMGIAAWDAAGTGPVGVGDMTGDPWADYTVAYLRTAGVAEADLPEAIIASRVAFRSPTLWSRPIEASVAALPAIIATGLPVAMVSNADGRVEELLRATGICQVGPGPLPSVAAVVDSTVVGIEKPHPGIFEIALEAVGVGPRRAIHVGDSIRADVAGARAAGVNPLHFDPVGLCPAADHLHVRSLADLPGLLAG
jgi:putative hydrolase of the HAD superfamily